MSKKKCILIAVTATFLITVLCIFCLLACFTPLTGYMTVRSLILNSYMEDVDAKTLDDAALSGMMEVLGDPHTMYFPEEEYKMIMEDLNSEYYGIGVEIYVDPEDSMVTIAGVFDNTPASRAGIRPGDKIIKVNDLTVTSDTYTEMVSLLKSDENVSEFGITLMRDGEQITVTAERSEIKVDTVKYKKYGDIAYIGISGFSEPTAAEFENALRETDTQNSAGLIIDLRNNPGGLLTSAVEIADMLLPECDIVYTQDKNGKRQYHKSDAEQTDVPMVILMNGNSASAAEIFIGALCDNKNTPTVGTKSYGKGCVQSLVSLPGELGAAKLTTAYYYSPSGVCIHGIGFTPDYEVQLPGELSDMSISALTEQQDTQLLKALEILQN